MGGRESRALPMVDSLERDLDQFLAGIGFELVALERAGGRRRPLLRLRVDRPEGRPGHSRVTVDDCAEVSRAVRGLLADRAGGETDWILEVSSPGIRRPLTKPRDFRRFCGEKVHIRTSRPLGSGSRHVLGVLVGLREEGPEGVEVLLEVEGEQVTVALAAIARATLAYEFAE